MKSITSYSDFVQPLTPLCCDIDTAENFEAITEDADCNVSDIYQLTLQKQATYQPSPLSEATHPELMTLAVSLEIARLTTPAKPRIDEWVSRYLPGWVIVDWYGFEPVDDNEELPF